MTRRVDTNLADYFLTQDKTTPLSELTRGGAEDPAPGEMGNSTLIPELSGMGLLDVLSKGH